MFCICVDVYNFYEGDDFDKIHEVISTLKNKRLKLQQLKGKTKLKFHQILSNYYDELNIRGFRYEGDPFFKNAHGMSKIIIK